MSIAASDYNIKYMSVGIALSFISFISVVPSLSYVLNGYSMSSLLGVTFTILYSVMMFASSFVEEEQHFWYWSLSGWILYLYFSRSVLLATFAVFYLLILMCNLVYEQIRNLMNHTLLTRYISSHYLFIAFLSDGTKLARNLLVQMTFLSPFFQNSLYYFGHLL